ncbi:MAG: hypothetical protein ABJE47_22275 [bacterium]
MINVAAPRLIGRVACAGACIATALACTEPGRAGSESPSAVPLEARIELSDSLAVPGSDVMVTARFVGTPLASVTARLLYDTTGVTLLGEVPMSDGASRMMNPGSGVVRFAGVAATGFADGRVYAWRFKVRRPDAIRALRLVIDEAHTASRVDAAAHSRNP